MYSIFITITIYIEHIYNVTWLITLHMLYVVARVCVQCKSLAELLMFEKLVVINFYDFNKFILK